MFGWNALAIMLQEQGFYTKGCGQSGDGEHGQATNHPVGLALIAWLSLPAPSAPGTGRVLCAVMPLYQHCIVASTTSIC